MLKRNLIRKTANSYEVKQAVWTSWKLRLIDLIKISGITDKTFLDSLKELDQSCEICFRYKKPNLRPIVGSIFGAHDFNVTGNGSKTFQECL